MKRLPLVILAVAIALLAVVTGCGDTPRYDGRLAQVDSLMRSNPDSALALLQGLDSAAFATAGDSAYRDLLLTQARYRCYVTATSDSDINRALAYYCSHPKEREKLTRAYIYKGAVMEELGHPDSAMLYYKHAEATADTTDYYNLGYINLRIADLFLNEVAEDSSVVERLHQAIGCFEKLRDTTLLISALGKLAMQCGISVPDSAKSYLLRAITLARQSNNPQELYTHESILAGIYLFQKEYSKANQLAMDVLRHGRKFSFQNQYFFYAAMSFIKMGMIDSAKYVMSMIPPPEDEVDSMAYYDLSAELSKVEGQIEQYGNSLNQSNKVENDILLSSRKGELMVIDSVFEHSRSESRMRVALKRDKLAIIVAIASVILLTLFIWGLKRRHKAVHKAALQEKECLAKELELALAELKKRQQDANDTDISRIVGMRLEAIHELYQCIRVKDNDSSKVKKIVPLTSFLKSLHERKFLLPLEVKDTFWQKIRASVDGELNGIVTFVERNYPALTTRDLQFFTLICAKISPQLIRLCMGITNAKSVTNTRGYLMKKMNLNLTFDEFVTKYKKGDIK